MQLFEHEEEEEEYDMYFADSNPKVRAVLCRHLHCSNGSHIILAPTEDPAAGVLQGVIQKTSIDPSLATSASSELVTGGRLAISETAPCVVIAFDAEGRWPIGMYFRNMLKLVGVVAASFGGSGLLHWGLQGS